MSDTKLSPGSIKPELNVSGGYQRFLFSEFSPDAKIQLHSKFVPTSTTDSTIKIESRNSLLSGFRMLHTTKDTNLSPFGVFKFQSFNGDSVNTDIFGFDGTELSIYNSIDLNNNTITNLAPGVAGTDAVNKNQLTAAISAGTVVLTGNVTGSGVVGTPFATTIVSTLNNIPVATGTVNLNNQNVTNGSSIGVGLSAFGTADDQIQFANVLANRKIVLWQGGANAFQFYGFGVQGGTLYYSVGTTSDSHVFYAGASSSTSSEVGRITGGGKFVSPSTVFGRRPGISAYLNNNATNTPVASPVGTSTYRILGAHTLSTTASEFVLTTSNPLRLTYTPTGLTTNPTITVRATATISYYYNSTAAVRFFILKNGTIMPGGQMNTICTAGINQVVSLQLQTTMTNGDYIEFAVGATPADAIGFTVDYGQFNVVAV